MSLGAPSAASGSASVAERTGIQWADATWNPWHGCTKVSPGCTHCYMYREKEHYGQDPREVVRSKTTFTAPLKWKDRKRVFTCSWSDWFHEAADAWRDEAWDIIRRTPHHTYLILTKRPERIAACLPKLWGFKGWGHVWLGVSVETQEYTARIPQLLSIPARVHFLSLEPLLGPLNVVEWLVPPMHVAWGDASLPPAERQQPTQRDLQAVAQLGRAAVQMHGGALVDWVIVGGESGPGFRPMDTQWARHLRDQCQAAGVPFFFKQYSGLQPKELGRELDGVEWTQWPAA